MENYYRSEIDGMRAVAVFSVILSHAGQPFVSLLPGGFLGVDVFFVISGFLITGILTRELTAGEFSLVSFYERRARRILPALIVVTLAAIPFSWVLMTPDQMAKFSQSIVAQTAFVSNFYFWMTSGYFAPASETQPMLHTWSLAVEEQYYMIFPLVFLLIWRKGWVLPVLSFGLILGISGAEILAREHPSFAFYLLPARCWELLAGAIAGYYVTTFGLPDGINGSPIWRKIGKHHKILSLAGFVMIAFSLATYHSRMTIPGVAFILPIGGAVLLLTCTHTGGAVYNILRFKPLSWIGLISYSAYLWHQPVFAFFRLSQLEHPTPAMMIFIVCIVFLLAWASWYFIEQPFRSRQIRIRHMAIGCGTALTLLGTFGLMGHLSEGYKDMRLPADIVSFLETSNASPLRDRCHSLPAQSACKYFVENPVTWAVFGDSHGVELAFALGKVLEKQQEGVLHLTRSGCPPALTFATSINGCGEWTKNSVNYLKNNPHISNILITYRHALYLYGEATYPDETDDTMRILSGGTIEEKRNLYWSSFQEIVNQLRNSGHRLVILLPIPEIEHDISAFIMHHKKTHEGTQSYDPKLAGSIYSIPRSDFNERVMYIDRELRELAKNDIGISVIDSSKAFCDEVNCFAALDGHALYFDNNHPSVLGAARILQMTPELFEEK